MKPASLQIGFDTPSLTFETVENSVARKLLIGAFHATYRQIVKLYIKRSYLCWNREKVREAHHSRYSAMKLAWKTATWQTDMALTEALS